MKNILLIGTSRLHRPFAKIIDGSLRENVREGINVIYTKTGYLSSSSEAVQLVRFFKDSESLPIDLRKYIFRVEPRATTPLNEFEIEFETAIRNSQPYSFQLNIDAVDCLVLEISSLSHNRYQCNGKDFYLHANPNLEKNVSYSEIYPEGFWEKYRPELLVKREAISAEKIFNQLLDLKKLLPSKCKFYVMGHLQSKKYPNKIRQDLNEALRVACDKAQVNYIDTAPFLDEYGFSTIADVRDPHHLSSSGEIALGKWIQELAVI